MNSRRWPHVWSATAHVVQRDLRKITGNTHSRLLRSIEQSNGERTHAGRFTILPRCQNGPLTWEYDGLPGALRACPDRLFTQRHSCGCPVPLRRGGRNRVLRPLPRRNASTITRSRDSRSGCGGANTTAAPPGILRVLAVVAAPRMLSSCNDRVACRERPVGDEKVFIAEEGPILRSSGPGGQRGRGSCRAGVQPQHLLRVGPGGGDSQSAGLQRPGPSGAGGVHPVARTGDLPAGGRGAGGRSSAHGPGLGARDP